MKWKLNIRKEIRVIASLVGVSLLIAFTEKEQGGLVCKNIVIQLENTRDNYFMEEADVMKLVEAGHPAIRGSAVHHINLKEIESTLKEEKHIQDAQLYSDLKGNLVVEVKLRRPIARIIQEDAPDAYIAEDGTTMPVSDKFTSRVVLVSGGYVKTLLEKENLYKCEEGEQLMGMIKMIDDNEFWKAQVAQIDVNKEGKVTIYPQVTGQRVEFGLPTDLEVKFRKLMIFYKEILPQRGWTKYGRVNLEYEGQVIAE